MPYHDQPFEVPGDPPDSTRSFLRPHLPTAAEIEKLEALVSAPHASETDCHKLFLQHPSLLAPLGILRGISEATVRVDEASARRTDLITHRFTLRPVASVVELKGPHDLVIDSIGLSTPARIVIGQLREKVRLLAFPNSFSSVLKQLEPHRIDRVGLAYASLVTELPHTPKEWTEGHTDRAIAALHAHGVELIAIMGCSAQFASREAHAQARGKFAEAGCRLICYDEVASAARRYCDLINNDEAALKIVASMFDSSDPASGVFVSGSLPGVTNESLNHMVSHLLSNRDNVNLIGGITPPRADYAFTVSVPFDIRKVEEPPRYLGGLEDLKWAGRWEGRWIVVKVRLSGDLFGDHVWYEFGYPDSAEAIVGNSV